MDKDLHDRLCIELLDLAVSDSDLCWLNITPDMVGMLVSHLELLIKKNQIMNLTRITNEHEALVLHIIDSLLLIAHKPDLLSNESRLLDIGTGAGYPGIPLSVVSGCSGALIDSVGKKVSAVQEFVDTLGLADRIVCLHARAEEVPTIFDKRFDVVTARAVAQTNILIEYAAPCLRRNGTLLVSKGNPSDEELLAASEAAKICGLQESVRLEYELPEGLGHRTILSYVKTGNPRIKLPRPNGVAKKHPLGV